MLFYSKTTGGFYDTTIHGNTIPNDAVKLSQEEHAALLAGQADGKRIVPDAKGFPVLADPPAPTEAEVVASYTRAVQTRLDKFAQTRGYDSCLSACTYATSTNTKFAAEGQHCVNLRDATWAKCYEIMDAVKAGTRPMPTLEALFAELPVLEWGA